MLLSVADNGRGVPVGELPRLFERFFRGDRARTTHGTGSSPLLYKDLVIFVHDQNQADSVFLALDKRTFPVPTKPIPWGRFEPILKSMNLE